MDPISIPLQAGLRDRYTIERELGRGGMAIVYLARDLKHQRRVAIKVLRPDLASVVGAERFLSEIRVTASLEHPHTVPLFDSGEFEGQPYFVMRYVEGESLRARLERERQLPIGDALRITREVASALDYAHRRGIVHRDIKPENILLQDGTALVADFGVSLAVSKAGGDRLTATGISVGTPEYMSPEQAAGESNIDGRSDVYSLGCVVYEMLAGDPPFMGSTAQAISARRFVGSVPSLRAVRETVPEAVERAIQKALAKAPADRFPTPGDFAAELTAAADADVLAPSIVGKRWAAIAASIIALGLIGWVGAKLRSSASDDPAVSKSIAVLPCENLSRDTARAYIADRWTEELIERLQRVAGLRPKSWLSVQSYRATTKNSREIARELGTHTFARCRVAEGTDSVRFSVQLIRGADDQVVWSDEYTRRLSATGINDAQTGAARGIAAALGAAPSSSERAQLEQPLTNDLEALRLYRLGRHLYDLHTFETLPKAIESFRAAIARDSGFARAYVELASTIANVNDPQFVPARLYCPEVMALRRKALAINPAQSERDARLAYLSVECEYNWPEAEREYRRALELDSLSVDALSEYGIELAVVGRSALAVSHLEKAVEIDPTAHVPRIMLVFALRGANQHSRALAEARRGLDLFPYDAGWHVSIGRLLLLEGKRDSSIAELEKGERLGCCRFWAQRVGLASAYAAAGRPQRAQTLLDELLRLAKGREIDPTPIAQLQLALGRKEEAMRLLQRAYDERSHALLVAVNLHHTFDDLRDDPRFQALKKRITF